MALKRQLQLLRENLKQHQEILKYLQSVTEDEAVAALRRLRSTRNSSAVLASIKGDIHTAERPSEARTAHTISPPNESDIESELSLLHNPVHPHWKPLCPLSVDFGVSFPQSPRGRPSTPEPLIRKPGIGLSESGIDPVLSLSPPSPLRELSSNQSSPFAGLFLDGQHVDPQLGRLDFDFWTQFSMSNELAT